MAKHPCDCKGANASLTRGARPRVVNMAGEDLGPFNWETAVGSDIARGSPPPAAMQRGLLLQSVVLASGETVIPTDAIRYIMEGARHIGPGEQASSAELEKFRTYLGRTAKPRISVTPAEGAEFGLGPREASVDAPYEGFLVTSFSRAEGEPLPGARSTKRHLRDEVPSMLNGALLVNMRRGHGDPFPAFRPGKRDGILWGEPNPDGSVDPEDIDLPGADDDGDVYVRSSPDVPRHNGCSPMGTLVCRNKGTVFQPIRSDPPLDARIEFGQPQVSILAAHTVKVVIAMTLVVTVEMYQKMYRRIDCCCEFMGADFDCWTELAYSGDTPKDVVEERSLLPPMEHVSRDWKEWTLDLFTDMAKRAAEGAGGAVGGLAGDALKSALDPVVEEAKRRAARLLGQLGFGDGSSGNGASGGAATGSGSSGNP